MSTGSCLCATVGYGSCRQAVSYCQCSQWPKATGRHSQLTVVLHTNRNIFMLPLGAMVRASRNINAVLRHLQKKFHPSPTLPKLCITDRSFWPIAARISGEANQAESRNFKAWVWVRVWVGEYPSLETFIPELFNA